MSVAKLIQTAFVHRFVGEIETAGGLRGTVV